MAMKTPAKTKTGATKSSMEADSDKK